MFRLLANDVNANANVTTVQIKNANDVVIGSREYVHIDSILTDQQILAGLAIAATQAEINAVTRENNSRTNAKNIPNWASWTEAQALAWMDTNIGQPLQAPIPPNPITTTQIRAVLVSIVATMNQQYLTEQSLARMVIAMRDKIWANLGDV